MTEIDPGLRPKAYASAELFLDIVHELRQVAEVDLETLLIYVCIAEATMRPLINDPEVLSHVAGVAAPPENVRGSISMLLVADRLGIPRETVRRKVKRLIEVGLVYEDDVGRVRTAPVLADERIGALVAAVDGAVARYHKRVAQFGLGR